MGRSKHAWVKAHDRLTELYGREPTEDEIISLLSDGIPGRPLKGKERREPVSIRLEPKVKASIKKRYGTIQAWVDRCVNEFHIVKNILQRNAHE